MIRQLQKKVLATTVLRDRDGDFSLVKDAWGTIRSGPRRHLVAFADHGTPGKPSRREAVVTLLDDRDEVVASALLLRSPNLGQSRQILPPDGGPRILNYDQFGPGIVGDCRFGDAHTVIAETLTLAHQLGHSSVLLGPFESDAAAMDVRATLGGGHSSNRNRPSGYVFFDLHLPFPFPNGNMQPLNDVSVVSRMFNPLDIPRFLARQQICINWDYWLNSFESDPAVAFTRFIQAVPIDREYHPSISLAFVEFWKEHRARLPVPDKIPWSYEAVLHPEKIAYSSESALHMWMPYLLLHSVVVHSYRPEAPLLVLDRMKHHAGFLVACMAAMKDSRQLRYVDRKKILETIQHSVHDLLLVTHGTYTMPDSAQYVKDQLGKTGKTIVFTGSMIPLRGFDLSDAAFNLGYAIAQLQHRKPGVYLCMNGKTFAPETVDKNTVAGRFEEIK